MSVIYEHNDYENVKIGKLTIKGITRQNDLLHFECECDCGNKKLVRCTNLLNRATLSCGCFAKNVRKENAKKIGKQNRKCMYCNICGKKHYARGLCKSCYEKDRRNGHYITE